MSCFHSSCGDADGEIVGVGRGAADHGQHFAGARIESDDGAGPRAERLFGDLLQIEINGELNLFAGNGILLRKVIHFLADAVDDDAAHAVGAHQDVVVLALETGFADHVAGTQFAVAGFDLLFAGFTDVPGGVGEEAIGHITAARNGEHFEYGNIGAMRLDEIEIGAGGFRLDDDGLKFGQIAGVLQLVVQIVDGDAEAVGNGGEILFDEFGIVAEEQNGKRGTIVDQDAAIAIEHASARRDDGNGANAILFGHLAVLVAVDDLQFPEAEQQQADHAHDDVGDDGEPRLRQSIVTAKRKRHESSFRSGRENSKGRQKRS